MADIKWIERWVPVFGREKPIDSNGFINAYTAGMNGIVGGFRGACADQNGPASHAHEGGEWHAHAHGDYWHEPHHVCDPWAFDYGAWSDATRSAEMTKWILAHPAEAADRVARGTA